MTNDHRLTPLAASLPATVPFVGPEAQERARGAPFQARVGANENVFGPSPKAIAAMKDAAADAWMYADPEAHDLRQALMALHHCASENITFADGIDGLLGLAVRLFVGQGDAVVTSAGAYPTFNYHVIGYGGDIHAVPYTADHEDPARLIAKAREVSAKLVYISNPDNPMGTWHDGGVLRDMVLAMPDDCLLILDEAYVEFAPEGTALDIPVDDPRVLRMRTFSKAHGMAGIRIGYALGARVVISAFDRVRNHFGMSRISQAGALAAVHDRGWLALTRDRVAAARDRIADIAGANGLAALPSATNFVAIDCGRDGTFARAVLQGLIDRGVFVRMPFVAPQDRCIRVSAGTSDDLDAFEAALGPALADARNL